MDGERGGRMNSSLPNLNKGIFKSCPFELTTQEWDLEMQIGKLAEKGIHGIQFKYLQEKVLRIRAAVKHQLLKIFSYLMATSLKRQWRIECDFWIKRSLFVFSSGIHINTLSYNTNKFKDQLGGRQINVMYCIFLW